MDNAKKYQPGYYNPPETTYDWVKKDHIEKAPYWCSVDPPRRQSGAGGSHVIGRKAGSLGSGGITV